MTRYFIGIDNGSQSSKVGIFDGDGCVVASGRSELRTDSTRGPGFVEYAGDDLWTSIAAASRQAMARFRGDPADIAGIGLCTIRFCRALLCHDGSLAAPVMSWMDERVSRPHDNTDDDIAWVTTSSGYIGHRMTGEFRDSVANYRGMWPVDVAARQWLGGDEFDAYGIRRSQLFDLVNPGDVLGALTADAAEDTGLPAGLPVVATANDKAVEALGAGLLEPGTLLLSLGTYVSSMSVGDTFLPDSPALWTNFAAEPHGYLYESEGIRRGMWTVSWLRDLLGNRLVDETRDPPDDCSIEEYLNTGARDVPAGSDGLLTLPDWLAPADASFRRGAFLGFDGRHGPFHMYRSILEGIAMTMHRHAAAMHAELGVRSERVLVTGGGSQSDLMLGIVADVFDRPAVRMSGGAALGAAACAVAGLGYAPSVNVAARRMTHADTTVPPSGDHRELYDALGAVHADVREQLGTVFGRIAALT